MVHSRYGWTMTGPPTARGRDSRARIVATAARLMQAHGVEGTRVDAVLAATGASKSQLYHYFGSRQGLVRSVIAYQTEHVVDVQSARLAEVDSWPALRRWFDDVYDVQEAHHWRLGCPIGSLAAELATEPADHDDAREDLATALNRW